MKSLVNLDYTDTGDRSPKAEYRRKIQSDDARSGLTCFDCLGGQHYRCRGVDGCPCSICTSSHTRDDMQKRREARQVARTQATPRKSRAKAGPKAKPGPRVLSESEKNEIARAVLKLTKMVVDERYGIPSNVTSS